MKAYRIKIDNEFEQYVKGVLISEKGFSALVTEEKEEAGWYEEDKAKIYCENLNNKYKKAKFELEEIDYND